MRRLRERFLDELVVIGVHSAKFPSEQLTANIREAVMRHHIEHPVVNDAGFDVWHAYTVRAWPTIVLIDPLGNYVGSQPGEIQADDFAPVIERMIADFDAKGVLDRRSLDLRAEADLEPDRPLKYPSKVLVAPDDRLFVADTGHHRVLEARLDADGPGGEITRVFGSGMPELRDGPGAEAGFNGPHGLSLDGTRLYVADTDNHAVRVIDLASGHVRTVAGTGEKAYRALLVGPPTSTPLRSPWAVLARGNVVFIAMAGTHQIWVLLNEAELGPFAGNGREALIDGPRVDASFNQPSDLTLAGPYLFVADAEASAIRAVSLEPEGNVSTLLGEGLFDWGDIDGAADVARLQHPTGLVYADRMLYIADSYNHKIKRYELQTGQLETLIGAGRAGHADGPFAEAELFEPEGLDARDDLLFIADTNNHLIRVANLQTGMVGTLTLRGLERLRAPHMNRHEAVRLEPRAVGKGHLRLAIDVRPPAGFKLNLEAPLLLRDVDTGVVHQFAAGEQPVVAVEVDRARDISLDLTVYYCEADDERLCMIYDARLIQPVTTVDDGPGDVNLTYVIPTP